MSLAFPSFGSAVMVPLGFDREAITIAALIALIVAGLVVSVGAWVLLARERRAYEAAMASLDAAAIQQQVASVPEHEHVGAVGHEHAGVPVVGPEHAPADPTGELVVEPGLDPGGEPGAVPGFAQESEPTAVLPVVPPDHEAWAPDPEPEPTASAPGVPGEGEPAAPSGTTEDRPRRRGRRR